MRRKKPAPIPRLMPPLAWRRPALLWTPAALALAIGAPAAVFYDDPTMAIAVTIAGAAAFGAVFAVLAFMWTLRTPPRTRRLVVLQIVLLGVIAAVLTPFALQARALAANPALLPFSVVIGLPIALFAGLVFSFVALTKRERA